MRFFFSRRGPWGFRYGISLGPEDWRRATRTQTSRVDREARGAFVYVVRGTHGMIKVGCSTNPVARVAQLQSSTPYHLTLVRAFAISGPAACAFDVERYTHVVLERQKMIGEWFDVDDEVAGRAVAHAASHLTMQWQEVRVDQIEEIIFLASQSVALPGPPRSGWTDWARVSVCVGILSLALYALTVWAHSLH